ncbi:hypothetical protein [Bremerella sp.]|uniref:hypothetical protein n=1 Tax=Bremerella sp. TaxID=2795602 RepID=UPI00391B55B3
MAAGPSNAEKPIDKRLASVLPGWGLHVVGIAVLFLFAAMFVPKCQRYFEEFELDLPAVTVWIIALSRVVSDYWFLVFPVVALLDGVLAILVALLPSGVSWVRGLWFWGIFLLIGLLLGAGVVSMLLAFVSLINSL